MHKFKIGTAAKMMGISTETIRYYERKGVVSPATEESGHRYYDITDMCIMAKARAYMQYGFSLEQAKELLDSEDIESILSIYGARAEELEQEIDNLLSTLRSLRRRQKALKKLIELEGSFEVVACPDILHIDSYIDNVPVSDDEVWRICVLMKQKQTFSFPYLRFEAEDFDAGVTRRIVGIAVNAEDYHQLELPSEVMRMGKLRHMQSVSCLHTAKTMPSATKGGEVEKLFAREFEHIRKLGRQPGDIFCKTVLVYGKGSESKYLREVWIELR